MSLDYRRAIAYNTGGEPPPVSEGDFLLHHASAFHSKLIRFGEGLRFRGADRRFAFWNHASIAVSSTEIVEALGRGVVHSPLSKYDGSIYARVRIPWQPLDRSEAIGFARSQVGEKYGYWTLAGVGLHMLTGGKFVLALDGTEICSGLVARCLERGDVVFEHHNPTNITPADLARHFQVPPPE